MRSGLAGDPRFDALIARVRDQTLAAHAHQDLPFEKLVDALETTRDLSRSPFFQVLFVLHNAPAESLELPDLKISFLPLDSRTAQLDLSLNLVNDLRRG